MKKINSIMFKSMLTAQTAAICFSTNLFSCDIRESIKTTRKVNVEEAFVDAGVANPTAQQIEAYVAIPLDGNEVANRQLLLAGEDQDATNRGLLALGLDRDSANRAGYEAFVNAGVANPTAQQIEAYVDAGVANPTAQQIYEAFVDAGVSNPTAQQIEAYVAIPLDGNEVANRQLLLAGEDQDATNRGLLALGLDRDSANRAGYEAFVNAGVANPTAQQIEAYVDAGVANR